MKTLIRHRIQQSANDNDAAANWFYKVSGIDYSNVHLVALDQFHTGQRHETERVQQILQMFCSIFSGRIPMDSTYEQLLNWNTVFLADIYVIFRCL